MMVPAEPKSAPDAPGRWEHFPHVADVGVRGFGPTPARAFEQAALAMTAVVTDPAAVRPLEKVEIACAAADLDMLLAEWLNTLIYEMATRKMLFSRFEATIEGTRLAARAWGERRPRRHEPATEVKGAIRRRLRVAEDFRPLAGPMRGC